MRTADVTRPSFGHEKSFINLAKNIMSLSVGFILGKQGWTLFQGSLLLVLIRGIGGDINQPSTDVQRVRNSKQGLMDASIMTRQLGYLTHDLSIMHSCLVSIDI